MSIRTRTVQTPGRIARRAHESERVKSGAAQRAYARRRTRAESRSDAPDLPLRQGSVMATRIPFVVAIIALLGCGLALTLLLTTRAAEDSYQLGDIRATNKRLADERAALQREVEGADSAPELAARARELGMIPAKDPARIVVAPDGTVTVIGKPTPAEGPPVPPLNVSPSAPVPPPANNAQARGERVMPVTTTPTPAPLPAPGTNIQANAAPVSPVPASPVPPSPVPVAPQAEAGPQAETPHQPVDPAQALLESPQPQTLPGDGGQR
ncbi:hypothetical protein NBRGN_035_00010 [Nocardia brasiliensis NBRC 14402]|uniref:hypothetical protein n=1 Tax=Nocardia brasiliensis TaxID=37326 RepID=UPI0003070BFA|nr:hypothetical protein [Nocardia brasiliensis]ASF08852.1 hypothetical protein CEQ30_17400 [Nocardia brasiliensis]GAJ81098.1 hypothetical protein NBRGN_035_00010 [Nocardia brasiliensis NBRC 14402]SUB40581.1 Uncharacterised protein [Nocardia brasiliensis]